MFIDVYSMRQESFLTIIEAFLRHVLAIKILSKNLTENANAYITYFTSYGISEMI